MRSERQVRRLAKLAAALVDDCRRAESGAAAEVEDAERRLAQLLEQRRVLLSGVTGLDGAAVADCTRALQDREDTLRDEIVEARGLHERARNRLRRAWRHLGVLERLETRGRRAALASELVADVRALRLESRSSDDEAEPPAAVSA